MAQNNANESAGQQRETFHHILWDNQIFLLALSLVCALLAWLVVTMYFDTSGTYYIDNASVNYSYQSSTYAARDLDIVSQPEIGNVLVRAEGNNTVIGNMSADDIMVYPNYAAVSGPGEVTLDLEARIVNNDFNNQGIELKVERPQRVTLVFDSVTQKLVPVTADTSDVSIAEGYTLNKAECVPAEVTLRGPASELERIDTVVAPVSTEEELADNMELASVLELRDADGAVVEPLYTSIDAETANVTLTVYQVRELPLAVDFIGTPNGFDVNSLSYHLSRETLRVAGPTRLISNLSELSVTSFDLSQEFAFDRDFQRQIELPTGLVSQDGAGSVTLSFDTYNMSSKLLNVSNIRLVNVPSNYEVEVLSSIINDVRLYGPSADINRLSANSVQAQLDCQSLRLTAGQQVVPVTIQIPSSSRIFATGSYTVECKVTEK